MALFKDIFDSYIETSQQDGISCCEVCSVLANREKRTMDIKLKSPVLLPREDLLKLQRTLGEKLQLQELRLLPVYEKEQFTSDYLLEIIALLAFRGEPVNGFFEGCKCDLQEEDVYKRQRSSIPTGRWVQKLRLTAPL